MSKYTTEVRYICESSIGLNNGLGFDNVNDIITAAAPLVFNFNFPIFDEAYRLALECKILRHYYTREICEETVGLWKLRLQDRLNMIMPYYNKLYLSELLQFNPLYDVDITTTHKKENEGNENRTTSVNENTQGSRNKSKTQIVDTDTTDIKANTGTIGNTVSVTDNSTSSDNNTKWDLYSDTPQGGINGITNDNDSVANNTYLTNARKITENNQRTETSTGSTQGTQTNNLNESKTGTIDTTNSENENVTNTISKESSGSGAKTLNNTEDYIEHISGKRGNTSYSKMLNEFRKTFLNIDQLIIDNLNDLFFGLWE